MEINDKEKEADVITHNSEETTLLSDTLRDIFHDVARYHRYAGYAIVGLGLLYFLVRYAESRAREEKE